MVVVSYSGKEINAKLVYYGAGLSGKTTNLESIYEAVPDTSRGKMVSMKTQSDRTLFFDLLPLDLGEIMGFKTRFLLYTVPGQVFYNATRKLVLKGADAVVFVADSEVGKMDENKESLANLRTNLAEYGARLEDIPWVLQYNKRDLTNRYSIEELNAELNPDGSVPFFEAVASQGKGVFETFRGVSHLLMEKVTRDLRRTPMSPSASRAARNESAAAIGNDNPLHIDTGASALTRAAADSLPADAPLGLDFGREVSLPGEVAKAAGSPVTLRRPEMPAAPPPAPSRAQPPAATPAAMQPEPFLTGAKSPPVAASPPSLPAPPARPGLRNAPVLATPSASEATEAVIPITLPKGATREIVLRIVLTSEE